jgi:quercetin dioxygenase-like cupin family protein
MNEGATAQLLIGLVACLAISGCDRTSPTVEAVQSTEASFRIVDRSRLHYDNDTEVAVREHIYPPGWTAPTHFHHSDLFFYVMSGELEVSTQDTGQVTYTTGQMLRMEPETIMDARNPNQTEQLTVVIFQVGNIDEEFFVPIE